MWGYKERARVTVATRADRRAETVQPLRRMAAGIPCHHIAECAFQGRRSNDDDVPNPHLAGQGSHLGSQAQFRQLRRRGLQRPRDVADSGGVE